ncbi:angiogenic factor with G patch and FHA domains 1-like isoform X2 [Lytechinus variegatus]|uniref:angiogenic factor with G patch and FHA domains 1-like isoform X2 n=1 Tax=Lytechinus variegatus TaxID=7654 RepID=UPI001BB2ACE2|nr:angiogenic factor with G patch and FHA domains 1-like isoform X2 [Lytechinus variegatus]
MDESEDNEGKEPGRNSPVYDDAKEKGPCTNSDQNELDQEIDQADEQVKQMENESKSDEKEHGLEPGPGLHPGPGLEPGPSGCEGVKEDDGVGIQPKDETNEDEALVDGNEVIDVAMDKVADKTESNIPSTGNDEIHGEEHKIEMVAETVMNDEAVDENQVIEEPVGECRKNEKTEDKHSDEPDEIEMKDICEEYPDAPEDGEIVEVSQPSTSQDVSTSQVEISLEEEPIDEEFVEIKTFNEAKERIAALEERIKTEVKHRTDLMKQVRSLSKELHKLKGGSGLETQNVAVQTEPECIQIYDEQTSNPQAEVYQVVDSSSTAQQGSSTASSTPWPASTQAQASSSTGSQSIAESLRATAEYALARTNVVLDEYSGMYYDYNSGYYYDPNNHLHYDPARGIYYFYDEQTQSYQFHSKIDLPGVTVGGTGSSRGQPDRRRQERDRQKGDRSRRRRNHQGQSRDESGSNDRASTSRVINPDCEVIDITSPAEDYPENGTDVTSTATATTTRPQEPQQDQTEAVDVVEIVDVDDSSRRRHRKRLKYSHSRRKRRKAVDDEGRKENGEELPDVIVIDSDESDMEEGECSDSSSESGGSSKGESMDDEDVSEESMVIDDDDDDVQSVEATKVDYPPCIRMIVVRSESMKLGSLSIVTCTGGTIGREGSNHILLVPELGVSKTHAQMSYDTERRGYTITDLGSQNGTVLNGVPLTRKSRVKSDPQPLSHKDYLTFGTTTLRIHIHRGDETCDECEPGQVQATFRHQKAMEVTPVLSQADKEQQRRKELRKIKKKYLLVGADYSQREPSRGHPGYKDRAEERRVTVGSDNPYLPNDIPASVDRAISDSNMGHKMLKKMGWKEGQSLGKNESGIKEPIQVFLHGKKSGLGAGNQKSMDSLGLIGKRKSDNWERARDRYHYLDQGNTSGASTSQQSTRSQEIKWVKGTTRVPEDQTSSAPQDDDVELIAEVVAMEDGEARKNAVTKDRVCDVDMDEAEKNDGAKQEDSSTEKGLSKNGICAEKKTCESLEGLPPASEGSSKTIPTSSSDVTMRNDLTENMNNTESESMSKEPLNQLDGKDSEQSQEESMSGKTEAKDQSRTRSKDEQKSVEVPAEREAAKKPIRFVIPPRMNSKGDSGKTPLAASRSFSENNGEGTSTRRTRQSSRRGKEKKDSIDMFDNG